MRSNPPTPAWEPFSNAARSAQRAVSTRFQPVTSRLIRAQQGLNNKLEALGGGIDAKKAAVAEAVLSRTWAPMARSPAGTATLQFLASREINRRGPVPTGAATILEDGERPVMPLDPTTGAVPGSAVDPTQKLTLKTHDGRAYQLGAPASVPASYWVGAPGGPFGQHLPIDFALRPELARPLQGAYALTTGVMKSMVAVTTASLVAGYATNSLQTGHFVSGEKTRTPEEVMVDRIVNWPDGTDIYYVQASIPFTPKDWNLQSTLYAGQRLKPYTFDTAYIPGQKGVQPWFNASDGLTGTLQSTHGYGLGFVGLYAGEPNLYSDTTLIANFPRDTNPLTQINLLPTKQRQSWFDGRISHAFSPLSFVVAQGISVGPARFATGRLISPAIVRLDAGTRGIDLFTKIDKADVLPFATVTGNPSYLPIDQDPIVKSGQRTIQNLQDMLGGDGHQKPVVPR